MLGEGESQRKRTTLAKLPSSAPAPLTDTRHGTTAESWSLLYLCHHHSTADLLVDLLPVPLYQHCLSTCSLALSLQACESEDYTIDPASSRCTTYFHFECHHQYYHQCQCSDNVETVHKLAYRQSCLSPCQSMPDCKWWSVAKKQTFVAPFCIISSSSSACIKPLSSVQQPKTKPHHHEQRISKEVRRKSSENEASSVSGKSVVFRNWTHLNWLVTLLLLLCASPLPVSAYTNEAEQQQTSNHNGANSLHHRHKTGGQK